MLAEVRARTLHALRHDFQLVREEVEAALLRTCLQETQRRTAVLHQDVLEKLNVSTDLMVVGRNLQLVQHRCARGGTVACLRVCTEVCGYGKTALQQDTCASGGAVLKVLARTRQINALEMPAAGSHQPHAFAAADRLEQIEKARASRTFFEHRNWHLPAILVRVTDAMVDFPFSLLSNTIHHVVIEALDNWRFLSSSREHRAAHRAGRVDGYNGRLSIARKAAELFATYAPLNAFAEDRVAFVHQREFGGWHAAFGGFARVAAAHEPSTAGHRVHRGADCIDQFLIAQVACAALEPHLLRRRQSHLPADLLAQQSDSGTPIHVQKRIAVFKLVANALGRLERLQAFVHGVS